MNNFFIALNAVVPFTIYILFGYFVKRIGVVEEGFLDRLNQMVFKVFFPFTTFYNVLQISSGFRFNAMVPAVGVVSLLSLFLAGFLVIPRFVKENSRRSVMIQALFRSNTILFALPLAVSVFGEESQMLASLIITIFVPIYNVLAVVLFEYYRGSKPTASSLIKKILTNPLIQGALLGLLVKLLHIPMPSSVLKAVSELSGMATPLALFILGGTLHFSSIRGNLKYLLPVMGVKLFGFPAVTLLVSHVFGFSPLETFVYFSLFATPVAASSFPMAANMGGDSELAGQYVMLSTIASTFTLFLWIFFLKNTGII